MARSGDRIVSGPSYRNRDLVRPKTWLPGYRRPQPTAPATDGTRNRRHPQPTAPATDGTRKQAPATEAPGIDDTRKIEGGSRGAKPPGKKYLVRQFQLPGYPFFGKIPLEFVTRSPFATKKIQDRNKLFRNYFL